jgi:hypothetical protein
VARVTLYQGEIHKLLHSPTEMVHRKVSSVVRQVSAVAKATVKVDTGRLKNTHTESVTDEGSRLRGRVAATADYALAVHQGHGVIRPKVASVLVFRVGGRLVYAKEVGPVAGDPWLLNALKRVSPWPVRENPL